MPGPGILDRLAQLLLAQQMSAAGGRSLSAGAVLVFSALLIHADYDEGRTRPSVQRLAEITGLTRRNVQHALAMLRDCGLIQLVDQDAPRARGGRGAIARYVVAPHATHGDSVALVTRERASPATQFQPEKGVVDDAVSARNSVARDAVSPGKGVDGDAVLRGKGVAESPKGRRREPERASPATHEHSEHSEHVPPNPPRGAGEPAAASEDEAIEVERATNAVLHAVRRVGPVKHEWRLRSAVHAFVREGGTITEATQLVAASAGDRSPRDRIGLLIHWMGKPHQWRAVIADQGLAERESSVRRRAPSTSVPASTRALFALPAREGT
jgi:DNA-binding transcriptional ArsR family regulator